MLYSSAGHHPEKRGTRQLDPLDDPDRPLLVESLHGIKENPDFKESYPDSLMALEVNI